MSIHGRSALALASSPAPQTADWLLRIDSRAGMQTSSTGAEQAQHGHLSAFFHGVLFDRAELAAGMGVAAEDVSCAALVLAAYERYGEAALSRLRGEFAAAVVDAREDIALVARDPLGSHPLFYVTNGQGEVVFGGWPDGLLTATGAPHRLNRAALADHLSHRWPEPTETFFEGVFRVPPGHRVRVSASALRVDRYWDPAPLDGPVDWLDTGASEQFNTLLDRAVDRGLNTGPAGIFLSGGLDSISVAAVAAVRARRTIPRALSLAFPDPECDERLVQTSVAASLGLPQHLIDIREATGSRGLLSHAIELNKKLSSPLLNTWAPAYLHLAERGAAAGVRTILTGSGGDEWLSVSPYLGADLLRRGQIAEFYRFMRAWKRSYRFASPLRFARSAIWTYGLRPLAGAALHAAAPATWARRRTRRTFAATPRWVAPDPALRQTLQDRVPRSMSIADPPQGFYMQEVRTGLDHPLTSIELEEQYQFGQWVGVRFHHPYWDADLVDMLYRTPPHVLNQGGRSKGLVRDTLARRFPSLGFERQRKVAATGFYRSIVFTEGAGVAETYGDCRTLTQLGIVDGAEASRAIRETLATPEEQRRSAPHPHRVWDLLNLEAWVRAHAR